MGSVQSQVAPAAGKQPMSWVPATRVMKPASSDVNVSTPYGLVNEYWVFGQRPSAKARIRPKTICSPIAGSPFAKAPSSPMRMNALPGAIGGAAEGEPRAEGRGALARGLKNTLNLVIRP